MEHEPSYFDPYRHESDLRRRKPADPDIPLWQKVIFSLFFGVPLAILWIGLVFALIRWLF